jgi:hypothetical protein
MSAMFLHDNGLICQSTIFHPEGASMFSIGEFKGNFVITLKSSEDSKYPFTFGLGKAKLILEHYDEIKKFYEEYKDKPRAAAAEETR